MGNGLWFVGVIILGVAWGQVHDPSLISNSRSVGLEGRDSVVDMIPQ